MVEWTKQFALILQSIMTIGANNFPTQTLHGGMFGENFTTEGLMEDTVNVNDHLQIGSATLVASQPRMT
jgi:MOSC domain-containing protein YiiM